MSGYALKFDQAEVDKELAESIKRAGEAGVALAFGYMLKKKSFGPITKPTYVCTQRLVAYGW